MPRDRIAENATADLSGRQADLVAEANHNGTARTVAETYDLNGTYVSRAGTFDDAARPIRPVAAALRFVAPSEFLYEEREQTRYVRYQGRYYRVTLTGYTTAA